MMNKLISVVVPIYNVEKYLNTCITSIINQTYTNLEILLIDDGSTDNCPAMCDDWEKKDKRIKVIHKKNMGLGMARNTGIEIATGEYICFFDSDDYILPDALEKAYNEIFANSAEIVIFGYSCVNNAGDVLASIVPATSKKMYTGNEIQTYFLPNLISCEPETGETTNLHMSAWASLYSADTIKKNNWSFCSEREIIAEDIYSLLKLYKDITKVVVLSEALYCYRINDNSLSRVYREDRYVKIKKFYVESVKLCEALNYSDTIQHRLIKPYLSFVISAIKQEAMSSKKLGYRVGAVKKIITDSTLQQALQKCKNDKFSTSQKIFFWLIQNERAELCVLIIRLSSIFRR